MDVIEWRWAVQHISSGARTPSQLVHEVLVLFRDAAPNPPCHDFLSSVLDTSGILRRCILLNMGRRSQLSVDVEPVR